MGFSKKGFRASQDADGPDFGNRDLTGAIGDEPAPAPLSVGAPDPLPGDEVRQCLFCPDAFVFTARDREFYAAQGYAEPKRCRACRAKKKAARGTSNA